MSFNVFHSVLSFLVFVSHSVFASEPSIGLAISPFAPSVHQPSHTQFVLTCKGFGAEPNLFSNLRWFDPRGEEITKTYSERVNPDIRVDELQYGVILLHFLNPLPDTSGQYRCSATFQHSDTFEAKIQINFFQDVQWEDCPSVQSLVLGSRQSDANRIRCKATANPKPNVVWSKDGQQLENERRFQIDSNGVQINDEIRVSDGGVFRVRALVTETGRIHDTFITVQIFEPPQVVQLAEHFEGTEGQEATLKCFAKGVPQPLITWLDPNKRNLSSVGGYVVDRNGGALIVSRVRKEEDSGQFTCIAQNTAGEERRTTTFVVLRPPRITSFANKSFDANKESLLECRATGEPTPKLSLRRDGDSRELTAGDPRVTLTTTQEPNEETLLSLRLSQTRREDDGLYFCRASNRGGVVESAGHLEVRFAPDLSRTPATVVKTWNLQPINMTCVADAVPNATIRWWFRGQDLSLSPIGSLYTIESNSAGVSRLHVNSRSATGSAFRDIFGQYRCEAFNSLGADQRVIQLEEAFRPGAILQSTQHLITPTTITFRIMAPSFDSGMPVTAIHVQFREEDSDWSQMRTQRWPLARNQELYFLEGLRPRTRYLFRFAAENAVGVGDFSVERQVRTERESRPERPRFANLPPERPVVSPFGRNFGVTWTLPPDNGRRIKYFELKYYRVLPTDNDYEVASDVTTTTVSMNDQSMTSYTLKELRSNTYYRLELRAYNELGFSDVESLVFKTSADDRSPEDNLLYDDTTSAPTLSVGLIAGVAVALIVVLLVAMDVVFFTRYKVGAIYFLSQHVFASRARTATVAKTAGAAPPLSHSSMTSRAKQNVHSVDNPAFEGQSALFDDQSAPFIGQQLRPSRAAKDSAV